MIQEHASKYTTNQRKDDKAPTAAAKISADVTGRDVSKGLSIGISPFASRSVQSERVPISKAREEQRVISTLSQCADSVSAAFST